MHSGDACHANTCLHLPYPRRPRATVRAHQRDEAQVVRTSSLLSDVLRIPYVPSLSTPPHAASGSVPASSPSPARFLLSHPRFLPALARLAYYGLTFGAASQTIGEEYVDILPYSTRRGDFPSRKRRAWAVAALVMAPELLALIRERLRRGMTRQRQRRETASESTEGDSAALTRRAWLLRLLESKLVSVLPELWFAWFLIGGGNVDWSKSLAGLRYVSRQPRACSWASLCHGLRPQISPLAPLPVSSAGAAYQPVGWMVMLSLVAKLWPAPKSTSLGEDKALNNHSTDEAAVLDEFRIEGAPALECSPPTVSQAQQQKTVLRQDELGVAQRQCPLCLSPRGVAAESGGTAVTECGHIFCWSCIHDWADEKASRRQSAMVAAADRGPADGMPALPPSVETGEAHAGLQSVESSAHCIVLC